MPTNNLIVLHSFGTEMEAQLAKNALESAGIQSVIHGDSAGGMRSQVAWATGGFKVLVREDDKAAGRQVLNLS
jgi:hypothetical protein